MTDWIPKWKTTPDAEPILVAYESNDGTFSVIVDEIGRIKVVRDDWLSKYSLAIHGDIEVTGRYLQSRNGLPWEPIPNEHWIYEDEILLHLPSYRAWLEYNRQENRDIPPEDIDLPDGTLPDGLPGPLPQTIKAGIDVVGFITSFGTTGVMVAITTFLTIAGQVMLMIGYLFFALPDAQKVASRVEAKVAFIYAYIAWVCDDLYKMEPLLRHTNEDDDRSPQLRFPVPEKVANPTEWSRDYSGTNLDRDIANWTKSWEEAAKETINILENELEEFLEEERQRRNVTQLSESDRLELIKIFQLRKRTAQIPLEKINNDPLNSGESGERVEPAVEKVVLNRRQLFRLYRVLAIRELGSGRITERRLLRYELSKENVQPIKNETSRFAR